MDGHEKDIHQFSDFSKISLAAMVEIVVKLRAVIRFF